MALYVAGLCPSPYWLDSSEFAAAAFRLGIAHPPGHPLAALLGKACALLPLGSVALRVGLASALAGAAAVALTTLLGARLSRRAASAMGRPLPTTVPTLCGAAAGILYGCGSAAAFQAVRPEVYALNAALVLGIAWLLGDPDEAHQRGARLGAAGLCMGLALANHHLLSLTFAVGMLPLAWAHLAPGRAHHPTTRALLVGAGMLLLGLCLYAYLPVRAATHPVPDWGAPTTLGRFFWVISGKAFQRSVGRTEVNPWMAGGAMIEEVGAASVLAVLGAYACLRSRSTRREGASLLAATALLVGARAAVGFDFGNPDAYGYLEPAVALVAILAAAGLGVLAAAFLGRARVVVAGLGLVAALVQSIPRVPASLRADFHDLEADQASAIEAAPSRALLVSSYFQTVFALWYLRGVEGRRPDLDEVHRHFLAWPGYRDEAVRRDPGLAPLLASDDVAAPGLLALAERRPVLVEPDLDLDPTLVARLREGDGFDRLVPGVPQTEPLLPHLSLLCGRRDEGSPPPEPQTRRAFLWRFFVRASLACGAGQTARAAREIAHARSWTGGIRDTELEALAARCLGGGTAH